MNNSYYSRYYTFIKPILRNKHVRNYSSFSFGLILIIIFTVFALRPTISTILALREKIDQQTKIHDQLVQKSKDLVKGVSNYQKIDPDISKKIEELVPDKANVASLITVLNSFAASNQASISGIQVQPVELTGGPKLKSTTLGEVEFTFNISGSYDQVTTLMNQLNSSPRLLSVRSIGMIAKEGKNLIVNIIGKAFILK